MKTCSYFLNTVPDVSVSRMALKQFENEFDSSKLHFLDLIEYRAISNAIAEQMG
jgi:bacillithiol system protein YtxJ